MNTAECKELIVKWCQQNEDFVCNEFSPKLTHSQFLLSTKETNWKRISKTKDSYGIERVFDCKPFDDQLRAYAVELNGKVTISVQGE